jgi:hypothetical protein
MVVNPLEILTVVPNMDPHMQFNKKFAPLNVGQIIDASAKSVTDCSQRFCCLSFPGQLRQLIIEDLFPFLYPHPFSPESGFKTGVDLAMFHTQYVAVFQFGLGIDVSVIFGFYPQGEVAARTDGITFKMRES